MVTQICKIEMSVNVFYQHKIARDTGYKKLKKVKNFADHRVRERGGVYRYYSFSTFLHILFYG